jgi:hypothetical protein
MKPPKITFIINGTTYSLCASDTEAMRNISSVDRQHLVTLLEKVKSQQSLSATVVQQAMDKAKFYSRDTTSMSDAGIQPDHKAIRSERLGSGDIDALMARLVLEEKRSRKPALTKRGMYKVISLFAVFIMLLVLIF